MIGSVRLNLISVPLCRCVFSPLDAAPAFVERDAEKEVGAEIAVGCRGENEAIVRTGTPTSGRYGPDRFTVRCGRTRTYETRRRRCHSEAQTALLSVSVRSSNTRRPFLRVEQKEPRETEVCAAAKGARRLQRKHVRLCARESLRST